MLEGGYQILGFTLSLALIWLGIKQQKSDVTNTANTFYCYLFMLNFLISAGIGYPSMSFFLVGLSALLALMVFKRIRGAQLSVESSK